MVFKKLKKILNNVCNPNPNRSNDMAFKDRAISMLLEKNFIGPKLLWCVKIRVGHSKRCSNPSTPLITLLTTSHGWYL